MTRLLPSIIIALLITSSIAYKYDYQLILTYMKYLKVLNASEPAKPNTLANMLQTTNQQCMKLYLHIYNTDNIPDSEVERKEFSLSNVVTAYSRDMKEAYSVLLAGPLCNKHLNGYLSNMFDDLLDMLRSDYYEDNLDCFKDVGNVRDYDESCDEVYKNFTTQYVREPLEVVINLVDNYDYPKCTLEIAIKTVSYNYKAVVLANSDLDDVTYYLERNKYLNLMKKWNEDMLNCIMTDLEINLSEKVVKIVY